MNPTDHQFLGFVALHLYCNKAVVVHQKIRMVRQRVIPTRTRSLGTVRTDVTGVTFTGLRHVFVKQIVFTIQSAIDQG